MKTGKYDVLTVTKQLNVKEIKVTNDKKLRLSPQEKMTVESKKTDFDLEDKFSLFIERAEKYGFGVYVDKEKAQIGYGTREQFDNHEVGIGLIFSTNGISGTSIEQKDPEPIPDEEILDLI